MKTPIAKYTKNLYASEVYRELERQAVKEGRFEPTPEELVKSAAVQVTQVKKVNATVSTDVTDDLVQDVARLAFAMRRKGFVTQADELEEKLVLFKQAETALYNVTQESNEDFMDMAHPDGDFQIIDGAGELGVVETVESAAAKIRSVTEKNPTGKLAEFAALIRKLGVDASDPGAETKRKLEQAYLKIATSLREFPNMAGRGFNYTGSDFSNPRIAANYVKVAAAAGQAGISASGVIAAATEGKAMKSAGVAVLDGSPNTWASWIGKNNESTVNAKFTTYGLDGTTYTKGYTKIVWGSREGDLATLKREYPRYDWSGVESRITGGVNQNSIYEIHLSWSGYTVTWQGRVTNSTNLTKAGAALRQGYFDRYSDPVFGRNFTKLQAANAKLQGLPREIEGKIKAIAGMSGLAVPANPVDELGGLKEDVAYAGITFAEAEVKKVYDDAQTKLLEEASTVLSKSEPWNTINTWRATFTTNMDGVEREISALGDARRVNIRGVVSVMDQIISTYIEVGSILRQVRGRDDPNYQKAASNVQQIRALRSAIVGAGRRGFEDKPYMLLKNVLTQNQYSGMDDLVKHMNEIKGVADKDKESAQAITSAGQSPEGGR